MSAAGGAAGLVGSRIIEILEDEGYVAVPKNDADLWGAVQEKYEIASSALCSLAKSKNPETRMFAEESIARLSAPDGSTPFDDYRIQVSHLSNEARELRTVLERLVTLVDRKSLANMLVAAEKYDDGLSLEDVAVFEITVKEAKRCLRAGSKASRK